MRGWLHVQAVVERVLYNAVVYLYKQGDVSDEVEEIGETSTFPVELTQHLVDRKWRLLK